MKMMKCNVCEYQFWPTVERHNVVRGNTIRGIASAFASNDEPSIYDAFDCPKCGCQVVAQERKRTFKSANGDK